MTGSQGNKISRRTMLRHAGATAGVGVLAAFASLPLGASLASASSNSTDREKAAEAGKRSVTPQGFTDLAGIHAEYVAAIAAFPYALPDGVTFPAASRLRDFAPGGRWEHGLGEAEAFFFWQNAVISAIGSADIRGDEREAKRLLGVLNSAYNSKMRTAAWDDVNGAFASSIASANRGDYGALAALAA